MAQLNPYLTFNGNCREAMNFYKDCLGGELYLQTIGESALAAQMPANIKEAVLHAELTSNKIVLMGSDMCSEEGLIKGNAISIVLNCSTKAEASAFYQKLAVGGNSSHPLQETQWGAIFGNLTDKFGNHWLINYKIKM